MGLFDSVVTGCPKCGHLLEWQSKAGVRSLYRYPLSDVPIEIAVDLSGETVVCPQCGKLSTIHSEYDRYTEMFIV
jgi:endogenous inhibitor of DNA gyrase (YacG/DUF329 family)